MGKLSFTAARTLPMRIVAIACVTLAPALAQESEPATETIECRNGRYGDLSLFLTELGTGGIVPGVITSTLQASASFAEVSNCDSKTTTTVIPIGSCVVQPFRPSLSATPSTDTPVVRSFDAGSLLRLKTPDRELELSRYIGGPTTGYLNQDFGPGSNKLPNGKYTLSGEGGRDIPAFSVDFDVSTMSIMKPNGGLTNPTPISGQTPVTVEWNGGEAVNLPVTVGITVYGASAATAGIACRIQDGKEGKFTFPQSAWSLIPAELRAGTIGAVGVTGAGEVKLSVPQLDDGLNVSFQAFGRLGYVMLTP